MDIDFSPHDKQRWFRAAELGLLAELSFLIADSKGALLEMKSGGYTALSLCAMHGKANCLSALIEAGAKVEGSSLFGWTALALAAYGGHASCVELLCLAGASTESRCDLNEGDEAHWVPSHKVGPGTWKKRTPVMLAASQGREAALRALIKAGCHIDARGADGLSAVWLATLANTQSTLSANCVLALAQAGCDLTGFDHVGHSLAMEACELGKTKALAHLLQAGASILGAPKCTSTAVVLARASKSASCLALAESAMLSLETHRTPSSGLARTPRL